MFAARYFAPRYFANRYFPPLGSSGSIIVRNCDITLFTNTSYAKDLFSSNAKTEDMHKNTEINAIGVIKT